tara:strand:+ start:318 stop:572 length:255 start_codon:yes stop_codon:yes gene_type:complete
MIRINVAIFLLFISTPVIANKSGDYEKLEQCLHEFYQGRPRDYPPKAERKKIIVFKSENGNEYIHKKELRGMESVCYNLYASDK